MSLLSTFGAYVTLSYLGNILSTGDIKNAVCDHNTLFTSNTAWYIAVFNATKCLEWIDTVFLVLRKRKIIFLHWFHHLITYLYCWHGTYYSYRSDSTGLWFCSMNLFVHAIMYGYYALTTINIKSKYAYIVTILQFLQMVIATLITLFSITCPDISKNYHGLVFSLAMYTSYFFLFGKLLYRKLLFKSKIG